MGADFTGRVQICLLEVVAVEKVAMPRCRGSSNEQNAEPRVDRKKTCLAAIGVTTAAAVAGRRVPAEKKFGRERRRRRQRRGQQLREGKLASANHRRHTNHTSWGAERGRLSWTETQPPGKLGHRR